MLFLNRKYVSCHLGKHYTRPGLQVYLTYSRWFFWQQHLLLLIDIQTQFPKKILGLYTATCRKTQISHTDFLDGYKNILRNIKQEEMKVLIFREQTKKCSQGNRRRVSIILMVLHQFLIHTISHSHKHSSSINLHGIIFNISWISEQSRKLCQHSLEGFA